MFNSNSTFWSEERTPKSPHPGHQSGSTLPLKSVNVSFPGSNTVAIASPFTVCRAHRPSYLWYTAFGGLLEWHFGRSPTLKITVCRAHRPSYLWYTAFGGPLNGILAGPPTLKITVCRAHRPSYLWYTAFGGLLEWHFGRSPHT